MDSQELALLVLNSLLRSFHTFVTTITLARKEELVSFESLCGLLVMEDQKLKSYDDESSSEQAFAAQYKAKKQQQKKPSKKPTLSEDNSKGKKASKVICWNCG